MRMITYDFKVPYKWISNSSSYNLLVPQSFEALRSIIRVIFRQYLHLSQRYSSILTRNSDLLSAEEQRFSTRPQQRAREGLFISWALGISLSIKYIDSKSKFGALFKHLVASTDRLYPLQSCGPAVDLRSSVTGWHPLCGRSQPRARQTMTLYHNWMIWVLISF